MRQLILPVLALGLATAAFAEGVWTEKGTFVFTSPDETFLWRTAAVRRSKCK